MDILPDPWRTWRIPSFLLWCRLFVSTLTATCVIFILWSNVSRSMFNRFIYFISAIFIIIENLSHLYWSHNILIINTFASIVLLILVIFIIAILVMNCCIIVIIMIILNYNVGIIIIIIIIIIIWIIISWNCKLVERVK